jgi:hypothetical protein
MEGNGCGVRLEYLKKIRNFSMTDFEPIFEIMTPEYETEAVLQYMHYVLSHYILLCGCQHSNVRINKPTLLY